MDDTDSLLAAVARGEDSSRQFKQDVARADALAAELAAFANSEGGTLFIGVADDGSMPGLAAADVARVNQLVSNAASQLVRSALAVRTENIAVGDGRVVIAVTVPKGLDRPYFDKNGVIWLKVGADKRRVNSKEELRRFFQFAQQFHADEQPTKAGIERLDKLRLRDYLRDQHDVEYPESATALLRQLRNMNLATEGGKLNLAGVLLFAEQPELILPQFVVKAIRYPGNAVHATDYADSEDFAGPLTKVFADAMAFLMRGLRKLQAGRGVNAPGLPEIPETVFEELLVNALVHRDYTISAPIRLLAFDDRIEIISPGHLPNTLTVDKVRAGNSNIRNPTLASYVAKGLLPYHGLGSGIIRALARWPDIDLVDDRDGCLFTAIVRRRQLATGDWAGEPPGYFRKMSAESRESGGNLAGKSREKGGNLAGGSQERGGSLSGKSREKGGNLAGESRERGEDLSGKSRESGGKLSGKSRESTAHRILAACRDEPTVTIPELADRIGVSERSVQRNIGRLQKDGRLRRVGGRKTGHWEALDGRER